MSSWRLNGSKVFASCAVSLAFLLCVGEVLAKPQPEGKKEENHSEATISLRVTLVGITSYNDYLEIKTALLKSEGVERVTLDSEAPGLMGLSVRYAGEPKSLIEQLSAFFPRKYAMTEKRLPGGGTEINIASR